MKNLIRAAVILPTLLTAQSGPDVVERTSESTVAVLVGLGAGRMSGMASGAIVKPDGVILTAYHVIQNAKEVQIRMKNGDVYDRVELIGFDERRDVAALRIPAHNLRPLAAGAGLEVRPGETAIVVANGNGLTWTASEGIFSAIRPADEVPGAGTGYRVIQFTASAAAGSSGGPLVDRNGRLVGIVTKGLANGPSVAVPIENVIGLADGDMRQQLGTGSALQMPKPNQAPSSVSVAGAKPGELLRTAKSAVIESRTMFFTADTLARTLSKVAGSELGLVLVQDPRVADIIIRIDRPLFTYQFTYTVIDSRTTIVLASGKVTAYDGETASGPIAKELLKTLHTAREAPAKAAETK